MATKKMKKVSAKQALLELEHQKLKEEADGGVGILFGDWLPANSSTLEELAKIRDIATKTIKEIKRAQKGPRAPTPRKKK